MRKVEMATVTEPPETGPAWFRVGSEGWQNFSPVAGQISEFGAVSIGLMPLQEGMVPCW